MDWVSQIDWESSWVIALLVVTLISVFLIPALAAIAIRGKEFTKSHEIPEGATLEELVALRERFQGELESPYYSGAVTMNSTETLGFIGMVLMLEQSEIQNRILPELDSRIRQTCK